MCDVLKRLACAAGCFVSLCAAAFFVVPPAPHDTAVTWPVFVLGAAVLAAIALRPTVLKGWMVWAAVAVVAIGGTVAGLLAQRSEICCMFVASRLRGYPYPWLVRSAEYPDLPDSRFPSTFDSDSDRWVDSLNLVFDGLYWTCAGLVVALLGAAILRLVRTPRPS